MAKNVTLDSEALKAMMSNVTDAISHSVAGVLEKVVEGQPEQDFESDNDLKKEAQAYNERVSKWTDAWQNNGFVDSINQVSLKQMVAKSAELATQAKDTVTSQWYRNLIPNVISNIIREPISVGNPLTQLLTPVRFSKGTSITFPALGAVGNINCDRGEGEEFPELELDMSGSVTATIGKSGIAFRLTEEALRYSTFDIVSLYARQALDVLKRHKERKAAGMIYGLGSTFLDNDDVTPNARHTKGRNVSGVLNGTLVVDDLIDAYLDGILEGWNLDTIIVHPMAWQIFARDPILREQFFRGIAGGVFVNKPQGQAAYFPSLGVNAPYGKNVGPSVALGKEHIHAGSLNIQVPNYGFGFNVIVSNFAPISLDGVTGKYKTDIVMLQADQAGLLIVDEDITPSDWDDPARDIYKWKFRERYSLANINAGKAARVLKNVQIDRAYFLEDKVTWDLATSPFPEDIPETSSSSS